jgi:hypothetical protein
MGLLITVAHAYNCKSERTVIHGQPRQKDVRPQTQEMCIVVNDYNHSYIGCLGGRIMVQTCPQAKM